MNEILAVVLPLIIPCLALLLYGFILIRLLSYRNEGINNSEKISYQNFKKILFIVIILNIVVILYNLLKYILSKYDVYYNDHSIFSFFSIFAIPILLYGIDIHLLNGKYMGKPIILYLILKVFTYIIDDIIYPILPELIANLDDETRMNFIKSYTIFLSVTIYVDLILSSVIIILYYIILYKKGKSEKLYDDYRKLAINVLITLIATFFYTILIELLTLSFAEVSDIPFQVSLMLFQSITLLNIVGYYLFANFIIKRIKQPISQPEPKLE